MSRYALIIVLGVTFSMLMYSSALKNASFISNTRTIQGHSINQAQNIAQSAVMTAVNDARKDINSIFNPGNDETYVYPGPDQFADWTELYGSYNIIATNQGDSLLTLESTGRYYESEYTVNVGLVYSTGFWDPVIDQAVHAENKIQLTGGAIIGGDATINSTESNAVYLGSSTSIDSTLYIGPGGNPDIVVNNKHNAGGEIHNLPKELDYPMPIFPGFPSYTMTSGSINSSQTITPADYEDYYIPEINLSGGAILNIDTAGGKRVLHTGKFNIQSGKVNITGGGSLEIYVETLVDLNGNSTVNESGNVNDLILFYRGDETVDLGDDTVTWGGNTLFNGNFYSREATIVLNGTSGIQGNVITGGLEVQVKGDAEAISRTIYAPDATVSLDGNAMVRGSVISREFYAQGNAVIEYEENLDAEWPDLELESSNLAVSYWN